MNDDTRLRDGLGPRGDAGPSGSVAAAASGRTGVYAALDLGTNNCRLLIACPTGDGFRVIDAFSRIVRLGEGISATGSLSEAAMDRAIEALSICRDKLRTRKAKRLRLIATEACRAAANGDEFLRPRRGRDRDPARDDRPRDRGPAGGDRLRAAARAEGSGAILFDIGGGSSELARIERDPAQAECARRGSRRGRRSRSASSRWPSVSAARDVTPRILCADGRARSRSMSRRSRPSTARDLARHASARHFGHGDDAGRRSSRPAALRPPPHRRPLDEQCRCHRDDRSGCSA